MNKITLKKEPTLLKLKDFSTIHFSLIFKTDYVEDKILYPELINRLIITSCFDYKTGQLFSEAFVDNLAIAPPNSAALSSVPAAVRSLFRRHGSFVGSCRASDDCCPVLRSH